MNEFEFDERKSLINQEKHGIDFYVAQKLWDDPDLLEFPLKHDSEDRYIVIGQIAARFWSAVITYRFGKIRLISVRRSRKKEVELYESYGFR